MQKARSVRMRRAWGVVGLVALLLGLLPGVGLAEDVEGYCTTDDTPVITYWPPGWEEKYTAYCSVGRLSLGAKEVLDASDSERAPEPQFPNDFGRSVFLILNEMLMVNPYRDVYPYIVKSTGRTLIPLRFASEGIGAEVIWHEATRSVTIQWRDRTVEVVIGQKNARVNDREFTLDQEPLIWQDRTMIPLRFLLEAFGAQIEWVNSASRVIITLPGVNCPPTYCLR